MGKAIQTSHQSHNIQLLKNATIVCQIQVKVCIVNMYNRYFSYRKYTTSIKVSFNKVIIQKVSVIDSGSGGVRRTQFLWISEASKSRFDWILWVILNCLSLHPHRPLTKSTKLKELGLVTLITRASIIRFKYRTTIDFRLNLCLSIIFLCYRICYRSLYNVFRKCKNNVQEEVLEQWHIKIHGLKVSHEKLVNERNSQCKKTFGNIFKYI